MQLYKIVEKPTQIYNSNNEPVPGSYSIKAAPLSNASAVVEVIQTYDTVGMLSSGQKSIPEPGTHFLGELVGNQVYIVKFIDPISPELARKSEVVPKYMEVGKVGDPGGWFFRTPSLSYFGMTRNGQIQMVSSMGLYQWFDPYIPGMGTSEILDRLTLTCKNLDVNHYGGTFNWDNFLEEDIWKTEASFTTYRGEAIKRDENNKVSIKMGSLMDSKKDILNVEIAITAEDGSVSKHTLVVGEEGVKLDSSIPSDDDKTLTHSLTLNKDGIKETSALDKTTLEKSLTKDNFITKIINDDNTTTLTFSKESMNVETTKAVNINAKTANINATESADIKTKTAQIDSTDCTIKASGDLKLTGGGTLTVNGTAGSNATGPFNAIPTCPFSGLPHGSATVKGI